MVINQEICKGCELCISACNKNLLKIDKNILNSKGYSPVILQNKDKCNNCTLCATICPDTAITTK